MVDRLADQIYAVDMNSTTTKKYRISSKVSGHVIGVYEGETKADAVDAMARDAGYADTADMNRRTDDDGSGLLVVVV